VKSIAIITDHSTHPLGGFLKKNVEMVLSGFAAVHNYYLDTLAETDRIDDDVVMVMTRENLVKIKQALADAKKIILANRTIQKSEIYRICSIPPGTRVLMVHDSYETTMDFRSLLYKLGIDHLDLIPFQPQIDYPEIPIAVTPGERVYVPKNVENVIDTGNRHIDISTFIQIFDMLRLTDPEAHLRLYRYSENLVPLESGINSLVVLKSLAQGLVGILHGGGLIRFLQLCQRRQVGIEARLDQPPHQRFFMRKMGVERAPGIAGGTKRHPARVR